MKDEEFTPCHFCGGAKVLPCPYLREECQRLGHEAEHKACPTCTQTKWPLGEFSVIPDRPGPSPNFKTYEIENPYVAVVSGDWWYVLDTRDRRRIEVPRDVSVFDFVAKLLEEEGPR